ncbi:MAG: ATP-binding cassette domain-containing protein [Bacteroidaceae bacterium]|nr:ATP-binding cassette domain-containing protein [Bacteroidaceae bacterium]
MNNPFFEQLVQRIEGDRQALNQISDIFRGMIDRRMWEKLTRQREIPTDIDQLEEVFYRHQIFFRQVQLEGRWWTRCSGRILAFTQEGDHPVILMPLFADYSFILPGSGRRCSARKDAALLKPEAFTLCYPLPSEKLTLSSFLWYTLKQLNIFDYLCALLACLGVVILTMVTPYICKLLFNEVIPSGEASQLTPIAVLLFSAAAGLVTVQLSRNYLVVRMKDKTEYAMQAPLMARLLMLPTTFFKQYAPGDLSNRVLSVVRLFTKLTEDMLSTILSLVFTTVMFIQFFTYGGPLLWTGILIIVIYLLAIYSVYYFRKNVQNSANASGSKLTGVIYNLVSGAQKIRTNGAEIRAFRHWAVAYEPSEPNGSRYPAMFVIGNSLSYNFRLVPLLVTMIAAWYYGLGLSDYIAYCSVLTFAVRAVEDFERITKDVAMLGPELKLCTPILEAESEAQSGDTLLRSVSGMIDIRSLKFRYAENMPYIFNGLDLHINPGDIVAIVGPSGCGKSTLVRLLLGFERPESGSIFYDEHNLDEINKPSLRRYCVSICLQDGQLVEGTIRDNILFGNDWYNDDKVWEAARLAALDKDILGMPLGLDTPINSDGQGVSGGQRQRILMARSFIRKPKILFLDEATSALDNISQHIITENLTKMDCTRITIAHRMSTIRQCSRIIVLNKGSVAEDGTYDELMAKGGLFADIIKRQML